jgi:protein-disulfide isomerase
MANKKSGKTQSGRRAIGPVAVTSRPAAGKWQRGGPSGAGARSRRTSSPVLHASILGLLLGVLMILLSQLSVQASAQASMPAVPAVFKSIPSERASLGFPDAPVVITEWIDFQCRACRIFALNREPELVRRYIETGQVRLVSRSLAFLGAESVLAAEAAEAAADQGRYWEYRKLLFERQQGENRGTFLPDNLRRFAAELGLDQAAFKEALERGKYRSAVLAETRLGESLGVNATPTLFVNGQKVEGVPSMDRLARIIEEELAKRR